MADVSRYPDEEFILMEVLEPWGETDLFEIERFDINSLKSPVADIRIATTDGEEAWPFRISYVTLLVAAPGRNAAKKIAEEVTTFLTTGPTVSTRGLIDKVEVSITPRLLPVPVNIRTVYQIDLTVHTRARF